MWFSYFINTGVFPPPDPSRPGPAHVVYLVLRQVLPIWEGTTNVLSLDVLRAMVKSRGAVLEAFHTEVCSRLQAVAVPGLQPSVDQLRMAADAVIAFATNNSDNLEMCARDFAFSLARVYMGMLMGFIFNFFLLFQICCLEFIFVCLRFDKIKK